MGHPELAIGESEEAYIRCDVPIDARTPEHFFLIRASEDQQLYAIPREITWEGKEDGEVYRLTEEGALISPTAEVAPTAEVQARARIGQHSKVLGASIVGRACQIGAKVGIYDAIIESSCDESLNSTTTIEEGVKIIGSKIGLASTIEEGAKIFESNLGYANKVGTYSILTYVNTDPGVHIGDDVVIRYTDIKTDVAIGDNSEIGDEGFIKRTYIGPFTQILKSTKLKSGRTIPSSSVVYPRGRKAIKGDRG